MTHPGVAGLVGLERARTAPAKKLPGGDVTGLAASKAPARLALAGDGVAAKKSSLKKKLDLATVVLVAKQAQALKAKRLQGEAAVATAVLVPKQAQALRSRHPFGVVLAEGHPQILLLAVHSQGEDEATLLHHPLHGHLGEQRMPPRLPLLQRRGRKIR